MKYKIDHVTKYTYTDPVPICHNQTHLAPRIVPHQTCHRFQLLVNPVPNDRSQRQDAFGNPVEYFSIQDPHRGLTITASSEIEVVEADLVKRASPAWTEVAKRVRESTAPEWMDANQFRFASTSIPLRKEYADYARTCFDKHGGIVEACTALTELIHGDFEFNAKATNVSTPVAEVFQRRAGVCQDFAHFQIACLRSFGIPARYVSGYLRTLPPPGKPRLVGADASHAWVSVFCGEDGWIDFDPTNCVIPSTDHITIAWGRDYHDVSPVQGVFVGGGRHSLSITVDVEPLEQVD